MRNQDNTKNKFLFERAVPVWPAGRQDGMNDPVSFRTELIWADEPVLYLACADLCLVFQDGELIFWGPARAPEGYARVSRIPLEKKDRTEVRVLVQAYGVNNYSSVFQKPFFQAEIRDRKGILCPTLPSGSAWRAETVPEHVRKTQRISFQRAFAEYWNYGTEEKPRALELEKVPERSPLPSHTLPPTLRRLRAGNPVSSGTVVLAEDRSFCFEDRSLVQTGDMILGFPREELAVTLTDDVGHMRFTRGDTNPDGRIGAGRYSVFSLSHNASGLVTLTVSCSRDSVVYILMDEMVRDGDLDPFRMSDICNIIRMDFGPGTHTGLTMEPFTAQGFKVVVLKGSVEVLDIGFHEVASAQTVREMPASVAGDEELSRIWNAALETYRQNAVDLFTDCPSRERAGWLCDSFFTARTEYALTGQSRVEKTFLENYLLYEPCGQLPDGMLPMCFPADHRNGVFIPNWAMWLVLELEEYEKRSADRALADSFRPKLDALLAYLDTFLNADGLLEHLPSWVFVEWSRANEWVQDVNYPSNMLYSRVLEAYGRLYGSPAHLERAETMRRTILEQSYDGNWFRDHAVRKEDGELRILPDRSEVCQYFAFWMEVCSKDSMPELWSRLLTGFGPAGTRDHPDVADANAFVGNYLRLDLLARYGYRDRLLEDIRGYFSRMALLTGTLWENVTPQASLCHGFASHVICWLCQETGSRNIQSKREPHLRGPLKESCKGRTV